MRASDGMLSAFGDVATRHGVRLLCLHGSGAAGRQRAGGDLGVAVRRADPRRAAADGHGRFADPKTALPVDAPPLDLAVLDPADRLPQSMVARAGTPLMKDGRGGFAGFAVRAAATCRDTVPYRRRNRAWPCAHAARVDGAARGLS